MDPKPQDTGDSVKKTELEKEGSDQNGEKANSELRSFGTRTILVFLCILGAWCGWQAMVGTVKMFPGTSFVDTTILILSGIPFTFMGCLGFHHFTRAVHHFSGAMGEIFDWMRGNNSSDR